MDWITIIVTVLGAFGGISGFYSLYTAKSNKQTIDQNNLIALIEEERKERQLLKEDYEGYRNLVERRVAEVKEEVAAMRRNNDVLSMAVQSAFRCPLVKDVNDCTVWATYNQFKCTDCYHTNNNLDTIDYIAREEDAVNQEF